MLFCQNGYVGSAGKKGRGVFARKHLKKGETIEVSPYIVIPPRDGKKLATTVINSYWFDIGSKGAAIGLGLTSIYNHSEKPNAEVYLDRKRKSLTIKALEPIKKDKEITLNYGYELDL